MGVPGDRKDDLIIRAGEICGRYPDLVYIKEDRDLRGRRPGSGSFDQRRPERSGFTGFHKFIPDEKRSS